jgi:hypothetical protein
MDPLLGATQAIQLVDAVSNIESLDHVGSLRRLLQRS